MCDIIPGQLIVSHPREWDINVRRFSGAEYRESLGDKLWGLDLRLRDGFPQLLHLLEVEPGEENRTTADLYAWFSGQTRGTLPDIGPNYLLSVNGSTPPAAHLPSAQNFTFSAEYSTYKSMTGLPASAPKNRRRILIVDTGIASDHTLRLHSSKNILDPKQTAVDDDSGHGTAVALLIDDLAPNHEFIIYKAADSAGNMNEWDFLAALSADSGADVINLSVEYGLALRTCSVCGRQSSSSRSTVFEKILDSTASWSNPPVLVAAAGNDRATKLAYPARFGSIVAVGSVNKSKSLAQPSNSGSSDHQGKLHQNHFAAPGGDSDPAGPEHVIELSNSARYRGTSFACAFASAAVLATMDSLGTTHASSVLSHLRHNADRSFNNYSSPEHGNGIIYV